LNFPEILFFHSWMRWLILILLILSFSGIIYNRVFLKAPGKRDKALQVVLLISLLFQMTLGLMLYFKSPLVASFYKNYPESIHQTQVRFWGMEHITAMIISIGLIFWGSFLNFRKKPFQKNHHNRILLLFVLAFIILFLSIPWSFSPFTPRADFRMW